MDVEAFGRDRDMPELVLEDLLDLFFQWKTFMGQGPLGRYHRRDHPAALI